MPRKVDMRGQKKGKVQCEWLFSTAKRGCGRPMGWHGADAGRAQRTGLSF